MIDRKGEKERIWRINGRDFKHYWIRAREEKRSEWTNEPECINERDKKERETGREGMTEGKVIKAARTSEIWVCGVEANY